MADVTEVAPLDRAVRVPWAPTCVRGAVEHQGRLTTLVDLAALVGLETAAAPRVAVFIDRPFEHIDLERVLAAIDAAFRGS